MSDLDNTPVARLAAAGLIHSPVWQGATGKPGRHGYRGELALKLATSTSGEKRPPEIKTEQVIMVSEGAKIVFYTSVVDSLAHLELVAEVLGENLDPAGVHICFAGNVDLLKKYRLGRGGVTWYVLPLDESTVYTEVLELLVLEKGDLKKLDNGGKVEAIAAASKRLPAKRFADTTFAQAVAEMGPVKVPENRPV